MNTLIELWMEHSQSKFPSGYGGIDVNEVCVSSVDTYAAGCIHSYMRKDGNTLGFERVQILRKAKDDLEKVLFSPSLSDEANDYFSRLHEICHLIIAEVNIA